MKKLWTIENCRSHPNELTVKNNNMSSSDDYRPIILSLQKTCNRQVLLLYLIQYSFFQVEKLEETDQEASGEAKGWQETSL
mmetsp:Transcript_13695/g.20078  ORF Transcript_13695/g.20078 Transcript_13695/m.20078 type:complete len:81 (+) Transcript_13695:21-263(+)